MSDAPSNLAGLRRARVEPRTDGRTVVPPPRRRWVSRVIVPAVVLIAFAALLSYAARDALVPRTDVRTVPVVSKAASGGAPVGSVVATAAGWVEPDPFATFVSALTDGVVQEVLVLEGSRVQEGEVIARLVPDDALLARDRAQADVDDFTAQLVAARARYAAAKTDWDNPVEQRRAVDEAQARVEQAQADVEALDREIATQQARVAEVADQLERDESDVKQGAVSESAVVQSRLRLATARALLESLEAKVPGKQAMVREMQANLHAAQEDLRLRVAEKLALETSQAEVARMDAELARARARLGEAQLRVERLNVRAPVAGVVMRRLVSIGDKLILNMDASHSAHAVHLYDPHKLQVRVDVALADVAGVGVGQKARIVVEVLPDRVFEGVVTRVVHEADIQKNTLQLKVAITDPSDELKPEMLARVQLLGGGAATTTGSATKERVFAPERLLLGRSGESAHTWVVNEADGTAERRDVALGSGRVDDWIEVVSGLRPGDALIDEDASELSVGQRVRRVEDR